MKDLQYQMAKLQSDSARVQADITRQVTEQALSAQLERNVEAQTRTTPENASAAVATVLEQGLVGRDLRSAQPLNDTPPDYTNLSRQTQSNTPMLDHPAILFSGSSHIRVDNPPTLTQVFTSMEASPGSNRSGASRVSSLSVDTETRRNQIRHVEYNEPLSPVPSAGAKSSIKRHWFWHAVRSYDNNKVCNRLAKTKWRLDIDDRDCGETALTFVAQADWRNREQALNIGMTLLNARADVNAKSDSLQRIALHHAAFHGNTDSPVDWGRHQCSGYQSSNTSYAWCRPRVHQPG